MDNVHSCIDAGHIHASASRKELRVHPKQKYPFVGLYPARKAVRAPFHTGSATFHSVKYKLAKRHCPAARSRRCQRGYSRRAALRSSNVAAPDSHDSPEVSYLMSPHFSLQLCALRVCLLFSFSCKKRTSVSVCPSSQMCLKSASALFSYRSILYPVAVSDAFLTRTVYGSVHCALISA